MLLQRNGVLIVSALAVELRPWIDHCAASRLQQVGPWPVYANADRSILLLETGMGMVSAAAAVAHTMAAFSIPQTWSVLNIGIAGSGVAPVGDWVLANEVVDVATDNHYYLRPPVMKGIARSPVRSYSRASSDYHLPALLDMEAAAVVSTARRFVSQEQVGVLKLVSDSNDQQQHGLDKQGVSQLLQAGFNQAVPVLDYYKDYSHQQVNQLPSLPPALLQRLHFSVSHQQKLQRLWRSYRVFFPEEDLCEQTQDCCNAKEVVDFIEKKLQSVEFHWGDA